MISRQARAVRNTQALVGASRHLCSLTDGAVLRSRRSIAGTLAVLAETRPQSAVSAALEAAIGRPDRRSKADPAPILFRD